MKYALITGINAYPAPYQLNGCINDALDWQTTLAAKGFSYGMLLDNWCSKTAVLENLNYMVDNSHSGDSLVFTYSGHGSQVPNANEPDGYDEVLCTIDFFQGKYIRDDDLAAIFNKLPVGVTLDVFLDSCHAGTGTRLMIGKNDLKSRSLIYNGKSVKKAKVVTPVDLNHSLWAACKDYQLSREIKVGGKFRGAFTYYAASAVRANMTRAVAIQAVQDRIARIIPDQTPQLETTIEESLQLPFA